MSKFDSVAALRAKHSVISEIDYEPKPLNGGYTREWLRVDICSGDIEIRPVTDEMIDLFVGGKGFDMRLMWDEVTSKTVWDSPENPICISAGPLGGTTSYSGSGKSLVTSLSPATGAPIDSNVGGYFGPFLKFSGFDALVVTGQAEEERVLIIDGANKKISIESAPDAPEDSHLIAEQFTTMYADSPNDRVNVSVVSSGRGAEHTVMGCLNFSWFDWRRREVRLKQAGRGGIGTVLRKKKVRAIVAHTGPWRPKWKIVTDESN
jgi:aldehyde:ferredoxin oxidoreductase